MSRSFIGVSCPKNYYYSFIFNLTFTNLIWYSILLLMESPATCCTLLQKTLQIFDISLWNHFFFSWLLRPRLLNSVLHLQPSFLPLFKYFPFSRAILRSIFWDDRGNKHAFSNSQSFHPQLKTLVKSISKKNPAHLLFHTGCVFPNSYE